MFQRFLILFLLCCLPQFGLAQEKAKNPLQDFFRQVDEDIKEGAEEIKRAKLGRDQLDVRPPQRPTDQRRMDQTKMLIDDERWHDAVELLQFMLDQETDAFVLNEKRDYVSAHGEFEKLLGQLPEAGMRNYLSQYSPVAADLLRQARAEQDELLLLEISRRFLYTPAGKAAQAELCQLWKDRGEFVSAAQGLLKLRQLSVDPIIQRKHAEQAILLLSQAGQFAHAENVSLEIANGEQQLLTTFKNLIASSTRLPEKPVFGKTPYSEAVTAPLEEQLLIPRWSRQIIDRYSVVEQVQRLISDISDQGNNRALVPTSQAIIVNGNIAYRSLRGLVVRDPETGRVLWERRQSASPEERLAPSTSNAGENLRMEKIQPYRSNMIEQHTLASLLYRDSVYGCLTSSGSNLYTVRGGELMDIQAMGYSWRRQSNNIDNNERERLSANELVCYDLSNPAQANSPRWILGGTSIEDEFSRRLAGTYFFGPPVADGNELFVIGERDEEVSLFCLAAHTGDVLWSQPLTLPGRPIAEDMVRRFWSCLPLIQDDLVICPTGCGWLVAVDRHTHQLAWNTRYAQRKKKPRRFRGFETQNLQSLNVRWGPGTPVAVNGKILFTPPELPDEFGNKSMIVCIDQHSGEIVWSQPKATELYLAGIHQDRAIIITPKAIQARSLEKNGDILSSIPLTAEHGRPSGRCVIAGDQLLLPADRQLIVVDLKTFKIRDVHELNESVAELGNLFTHNGDLLSLSNLSLQSFQSKAKALQFANRDFNPLKICLDEAGQLKSDGRYDAALKTLLKFQQQPEFLSLSTADKSRVTSLEWEIRMETAFANLTEPLPDADRLQELAITRERKFTLSRLQAEQLRQHGKQWQAATESYLGLLNTKENYWIEDQDRRVRHDRWVSGRLALIHDNLSNKNQQVMESLLQKRFKESLKSKGADLLSFCDVGHQFELDAANEAASAGSVTEAIVHFQRAAHSTSNSIQMEAWLGLATVCQNNSYYKDAIKAFLKAKECSDLDDKTANTILQKLQKCRDELARQQQQSEKPNWDGDWEVVKYLSSSSRYRSRSRTLNYPVYPFGEPMEFMKAQTVSLGLQSRRLNFSDEQSGETYWNFPLMTFSPAKQHQQVGLMMVGPLGFAVHRGVIHAINHPEKAIRWTYSPQLTGIAASRLRHPGFSPSTRFRTAAQLLAVHRLESRRNHSGYLLAATPRCLLVLERDLIALDPMTGEELWRQYDVSNRVNVHVLDGNFLIFGNGEEPLSLSPIDGSIVQESPLGESHKECIQLRTDRMVLMSELKPREDANQDQPSAEKKTVEEKEDVQKEEGPRERLVRGATPENVTRRTAQSTKPVNDYAVKCVSLNEEIAHWSHTVPANSQLIKNKDQLNWITPQGGYYHLDLINGEKTELGVIPEELVKIKKYYYRVSDAERDYLFIAHGSGSIPHVGINPTIRVRGTIMAFDRAGGLLWRRETEEIGPVPPQPKPDPKTDSTKEEDAAPDKEADKPKPPAEKPWQLALIARDLEENPLLLFVADKSHRDVLYHRRLQIVGLDKQTGERKLVWERPTDGGGFSNFRVDLKNRSLELSSYNQELVIQPVQASEDMSENRQ